MALHEFPHQGDAAFVLEHFQVDPVGPEPGLLPHERVVLTNDDSGNPVEHDCAAAHRARREGCVERALSIEGRWPPPCSLEGIHLPVQDRAPLLHAAVMAAAHDHTFMHDDRSDRDASLGQPSLRLFDCCLHKRIHTLLLEEVCISLAR